MTKNEIIIEIKKMIKWKDIDSIKKLTNEGIIYKIDPIILMNPEEEFVYRYGVLTWRIFMWFKKLLCWLFGHKWNVFGDQKKCNRCGKVEKLLIEDLCKLNGHAWGQVYTEQVDEPCTTPRYVSYHNCTRCGKKEVCEDCMTK